MAEQPEIIWLLKTEVSFQEIYNWICTYSEVRAKKFFHSTNDTLDQAAIFPELGHSYGKKIRRILALNGRYGIFYRVEGQRLVVLGIEDLRQEPERLLKNLSPDE